MIDAYEVVIGFETHARLATRSKLFSRAPNAFGAEPNTQACAVDLALPGTLPVMNRAAVECAIRLGLALDAHIAPVSVFARKNYFYPDLPKGYQISQFEIPVLQGGVVKFMLGGKEKTVRLVRAHLEEDAGKSLHEGFVGQSGIDLNRAGTPLLEIVTEPEMRSSAEAVAYAEELHKIVTWIGICDGNMQEGSFRCDANVSVRRPGAPLGTRREIKNLNSFKFMQQAIDYEVRWQIAQIEDGQAIEQATVLFDPDSGQTRAMRSKEDAADYRYFPDPDLPPLHIAAQWVREQAALMPELPRAMAARFVKEFALPEYDAATLTQSRDMAAYFEDCARDCGQVKLASNWILGEVSRRLNAEGINIAQAPVSARDLATLIASIADGSISNQEARQVFDTRWPVAARAVMATNVGITSEMTGTTIDALIEKQVRLQIRDEDALGKIIDEVLAANADNVAQVHAGKDKALNALVGQVLKASGGRANPQQVQTLLKSKIFPPEAPSASPPQGGDSSSLAKPVPRCPLD